MRALRYWLGQPILDLPIVAIFTGGMATSDMTSTENISTVAATTAGVCAAAVGFTVTALSIVLTVPGGRQLGRVLEALGIRLIRVIVWSCILLVLLASLDIASLLTDCTALVSILVWVTLTWSLL